MVGREKTKEATLTIGADDLLRYAIDHGMLDLSHMREQIEMNKRKEILEKHPYAVWHNRKEDRWYTDVPSLDSKTGKKRIKRKDRSDLDQDIINYTLQYEEDKNNGGIKKCTLKELFFEFMNYKRDEVSSGTIRRMMADWKKFYEPHEELISKQFTDITKIDVDKFFNSIMDEYALKRKAFSNMCGILKQTFEYAIDAEYTEKTPYRNKVRKKKFTADRKPNSETQVYSSSEQAAFIEEMERRLRNNPSNTSCLAILLDFEIGTRKGEILALAESDIENGRIHVHRQLIEEFDTSDLDNIVSLGFRVVEYTKSEDGDRWIPLTSRAMELIQRTLETNKRYGYGYKDFLFVKNGSILTPDALDAQVKRGCEYIGIPVKTMHKIRKTFASRVYHGCHNISAAKDVLGHADETTTLRYYIYDTEDHEERDRLIRKALGDGEGTQGTKRDLTIIRFPGKEKRLKTQ